MRLDTRSLIVSEKATRPPQADRSGFLSILHLLWERSTDPDDTKEIPSMYKGCTWHEVAADTVQEGWVVSAVRQQTHRVH